MHPRRAVGISGSPAGQVSTHWGKRLLQTSSGIPQRFTVAELAAKRSNAAGHLRAVPRRQRVPACVYSGCYKLVAMLFESIEFGLCQRARAGGHAVQEGHAAMKANTNSARNATGFDHGCALFTTMEVMTRFSDLDALICQLVYYLLWPVHDGVFHKVPFFLGVEHEQRGIGAWRSLEEVLAEHDGQVLRRHAAWTSAQHTRHIERALTW